MKTASEVLSSITGLVVDNIARDHKSNFVAARNQGAHRLDLTVRDVDGVERVFAITAKELLGANSEPATEPATEGCNNECSNEGAEAEAEKAEAGCCGNNPCGSKQAAKAAE